MDRGHWNIDRDWPAVIIYPVVILMSGWLINVRTALILTGLSVMATVGLVLAEMGNWLPKPPTTPAPLYGVVQGIVSLLCAALIVFIVRSRNKRLDELSRAGSDLARRTRDLEASQAGLQRAQAVANVSSWELDIIKGAMHLSAETCRIFGLPPGTQGSHGAYVARVYPDDRAAVEGAWQAAFRGDVFDHEHRILSGKVTRWIRQKAELEFAADGRPLHAVGITQDITKRKQADQKITELAFFDQLTGLPNRTLLHDRLKQSMTASNRSSSFGALLSIDLDNFKTLNDTRGHDIGDMLLKQVAHRLITSTRVGDTEARLGGDEFVMMLPGNITNMDDCLVQTRGVGEKIIQTLSQLYQLGSHPHHCTSTIGVTLFGGGQHELIDEPLKRADLAMYQAKAAGRNTLRFFAPAMQVTATDRAALELGLREALAHGEFVLFYQALVTGDRQLTNVEDIIAKMTVVRTHGVGFALDDFGTGYSSLAYLSRLPLDQLKIDRSFVMDIESNDNSAAICAANINLAHSLGLQVVAEGVETEAQWHFLQAMHGCDCIQGYLIGRPVPIADFERLADQEGVALRLWPKPTCRDKAIGPEARM